MANPCCLSYNARMKWNFTRPTFPMRSLTLLILLAVAALALAVVLVNSSAALAGSLGQDSPVAPQHLSPLSTDVTPPAAAQPAPAATAPSQPPVPVALVAGVMVALVLLAILLGMRRR